MGVEPIVNIVLGFISNIDSVCLIVQAVEMAGIRREEFIPEIGGFGAINIHVAVCFVCKHFNILHLNGGYAEGQD
jgi:hypothetical protein